jgi:hypothetical protein
MQDAKYVFAMVAGLALAFLIAFPVDELVTAFKIGGVLIMYTLGLFP